MKLGAAAKKRLARAAQSEEARQALREANAAREATRLANMSSEQRQALREADAAMHATRLANMFDLRRLEGWLRDVAGAASRADLARTDPAR